MVLNGGRWGSDNSGLWSRASSATSVGRNKLGNLQAPGGEAVAAALPVCPCRVSSVSGLLQRGLHEPGPGQRLRCRGLLNHAAKKGPAAGGPSSCAPAG
jgi:hypothetical protein